LNRDFEQPPTTFALSLNEMERAELLNLLARELRETHVEARRTESPDYQDGVHEQETVLRGLIDKLRRA
jgi:hypothetical protein